MTDNWRVTCGDSLDVLKLYPDACFDSMISDPPAGISFMGKAWDGDKGGRDQWIAWLAAIMTEAFRTLKPGAHALVWALPRTSSWTCRALEDAGFEVRDIITHNFGSGFPKNHDISLNIDKAAGAEREVVGPATHIHSRGANTAFPKRPGETSAEQSGRIVAQNAPNITAPATDDAKQWEGWGTAIKPSNEHWVLCRKPLDGTIVASVLEHGTGGINVGACRVGDSGGTKRSGQAAYPKNPDGTEDRSGSWARTGHEITGVPAGRWPANTILSHVRNVWYTLTHDAPTEIEEEIHSHYGIGETVRALRGRISGDAGGVSETKILQPGVRWRVPEGQAQEAVGEYRLQEMRREFPGHPGLGEERAAEVLQPIVPREIQAVSTGHQAHEEIAGPDESVVYGASGKGEIEPVEGRPELLGRGIRVGDGGNSPGESPTVSGKDASGKQAEKIHTGTPDKRGRGSKAPTQTDGSSAPPKRGKGRQQTGESTRSREGGAHDRASGGGVGATAHQASSGQTEKRKPRIEITDPLDRWVPFLTIADIDSCAATCAESCPVAEMDRQSGERPGMSGGGEGGRDLSMFGVGGITKPETVRADSGGASRFFNTFRPDPFPFKYLAKPSSAERDRGLDSFATLSGGEATGRKDDSAGTKNPRAGAGRLGGRKNSHPTTKGHELMRWLCKLITPIGGQVLDPFAGSGTTGIACALEGFGFHGIELDSYHVDIACARISYIAGGTWEPMTEKATAEKPSQGSLF